jgi:hypothetical protein
MQGLTPLRFTSEDPLGFVDGANRYVYCGNNPVNFVDPWGLEIDNTRGWQGNVWYKPENSKDGLCVPVKPGEQSGPQDGFVNPNTGNMYKTFGREVPFLGYVGGTDIWVSPEGVVGGWDAESWQVDQEFIDDLHKRGDTSWDALWKKAQEIKKALAEGKSAVQASECNDEK